MIFFHKPYYNPNYMNLNKTNPSDICPKLKKLYKVYKSYNVKQTNLKKHRKKLKFILKLLNYKDLLIEKKTLILKNNQINFVKTRRKDMSLTLCDLYKLIFFTLFEKYIKLYYITSHMFKP
jgi:hypothetical protein